MKIISIVFAILANSFLLAAQNVGINNTNPGAALDVNGDLILRNSNMTLANGANENINTTAAKFSHYTITGPTTVFEIGGLTGGVDGRIITLYNSSAFLMIVKHLAPGSVATNQIHTGTGVDFTLSSYSSVAFRYSVLDNLWHITATHNEWNTAAPGSYWAATGNNISNTNSGNVGIGTASAPVNYKLKVNGDAYVQGPSLSTGSGITGGGLEVSSSDLLSQFIRMDGKQIQSMGTTNIIISPTPRDLILNPFGANVQIGTGYPATGSKLTFPNLHGNKISLWANSPTAEYGIGIQPGTLQFYTAGMDKMSFGWGNSANFIETMIYYPGTAQLGINCLPQAGYHLAVNGNIRSKEVVVETGWADYVFDKKYKLPALSEVEKFIGQNKHLPGIPSAQEIKTNGLKVGDMQTKMMQKIEELTLYIIEQGKKIEKLEKKLEGKN
jgi:hypothetical protein